MLNAFANYAHLHGKNRYVVLSFIGQSVYYIGKLYGIIKLEKESTISVYWSFVSLFHCNDHYYMYIFASAMAINACLLHIRHYNKIMMAGYCYSYCSCCFKHISNSNKKTILKKHSQMGMGSIRWSHNMNWTEINSTILYSLMQYQIPNGTK